MRESEVTLVHLRIIATLACGFGGLGERIGTQEGDALSVRRPAEAGDALLHVGNLLGFAAIEVEDVDLGPRRLVAGSSTTSGDEGDRRAIGRPLWRRFT